MELHVVPCRLPHELVALGRCLVVHNAAEIYIAVVGGPDPRRVAVAAQTATALANVYGSNATTPRY